VQDLSEELLGLTGQVLRELKVASLDILIEQLQIIVIVGWDANKHLIEDDADLVDIPCLSDPFLLEHLWGEVGWASTETLCYQRSLFLI
jgi:hypothetical protein